MNKVFNFANALFSAADDRNETKQVFVEAQQFLQVSHDHPEIIKIFSNSSLNKKEKKAIVESTFRGHFADLVCDFFLVLLDMNEFFSVRPILKKYLGLVESGEHAKFIKITSAYPLSQPQIQAIAAILEKKTGMSLVVKNVVDPSLIAGVRVESDARSLDWSIKGRLKNIETTLRSMKFSE